MNQRIFFFIARYSHSGVPLAQLRLAKAFLQRGFKVDFVIGYVPPELTLPTDLGFDIVNLAQPRTFKLFWPILRMIRSNQPDVIFSAEDHLNAVVTLAILLAGSRARLSVSSRVTPYDTYSNKVMSKGWVLKVLNPLLWRRADALTCVSRDMVKQYQAIFGKTKHQAAYNVIVNSDLERKKCERVDHPWFADHDIPIVISAGRLAPEKGYPDLIAAMKLVNERMPARLLMLGDGPLRGQLQQLIDEAGLNDRIQLLGFQANPYKYYARSRLFVLSSYVEGLPNVLVEAIACGCAVVSTDCPTGPREVLQDGRFGRLVPMRSPQAMAQAVVEMLAISPDASLLQNAVLPFSEDRVVAAHQMMLGLTPGTERC
jgi:glycosyltransferase involved in cell wall biosynthesis